MTSATHSTVLDIGAEQVGKTYARALLAATEKAGTTDAVMDDLASVVDEAIGRSPALAAALNSPRIDLQEKNRVIDRLFGEKVHPTLVIVMKVMAARGRLGYLSAVRDAADDIFDEATGRAVAEVRTAVPLDDRLRAEVVEQLSSRFGKQIRLREKVDPSIIGGMIVRVGDTVFDSSVASRLDKVGRAASAGFARKLIGSADRFASPAA